ncbi:hypothetical protein UT300007_09130 [Clostridium sp. CTA-7]
MKGKFKSFFAAVGYLLLAFVIQIAVFVIGGIAIGVYYVVKSLTQDGAELVSNLDNMDVMINQIVGLTSTMLLISSIATVLVFMLIYKIRKKKLKEEILLRKTNSTNIIIAVGLGLSVWLFNSGVLTLIQNNGLLPSYFAKMEEMLSPLSEGSVFIAILTVGIVAPFAEEFLFRGVVYKTLSKNISLKWTIVIQGILFGIYHGNLIQGIYAAFLGIIFGFATYKTKSLIPAIIMHMVNNTIAVILPAFISEYLMSTGTNIGFIVVGSIGMIISLFFITKKNIINDNEIESFDNYGNLS